MTSPFARLLVRMYPRAWRIRYGDEFAALLEDGPGGFRAAVNVVWSALGERVGSMQALKINQKPRSFIALVTRPSAFLPVAMSFTALAVVLGHLAIYGFAREVDEGATAHIWQLLMGGQMPVLGFFAIKWLPRAPKQTLLVLAFQAGSALASMAPVFYFNL
jgi:hypothetical protein